ncbi:Kazal-type serine protease inhibitor domain protein [Bacteriovorax sp. BAL6_X]|uniref:Kazal-type serine protease inhibitor family protein n=1 Tax=Bacteriovorax sp. BAL6_X TaxID=1201290 RepID=UPI0003869EE2|nr:Kazal-type serine protease inhibitor domain-containing protein [Bacteriovorax sp. BAL6_X]EPZ51993.1 Kazal-type serine protease inhibitor domain protein [Bacteriovorax sp. BAL6_X]
MKFFLALVLTINSYAFKCTKEYRPVCANGKTFANRCMAQMVDAANIKEGPCSKEGNKAENKKQLRPQSTSPMKPHRPQVEAPCICTMIWMPVCGVDGKTYGSACNANCEKVEIKHQGECEKIETH